MSGYHHHQMHPAHGQVHNPNEHDMKTLSPSPAPSSISGSAVSNTPTPAPIAPIAPNMGVPNSAVSSPTQLPPGTTTVPPPRASPDPANPPANRKNLETPLRIYEYVGLNRNSHQNQVKKLAREVYLKHPDLAADRRWSGIDKDSKCAAVEELKRACERSVEVLQNGRVGDWFYDWLLKRVKKAKIANLAAAEKKNQRRNQTTRA